MKSKLTFISALALLLLVAGGPARAQHTVINGFKVTWDSSASDFQRKAITSLLNDMVPVKGGKFEMGASKKDKLAEENEKPQHKVTLSSYYICKYEVTQDLWLAVMGKNPSHFRGNMLPVEQVSWLDCQTFIQKLNQITGLTFRLPTEAQWEYAARGGSKSKKYLYAGGKKLDKVAWSSSNSKDKTHNVGDKTPNELGLYDMSGNVMEWCNDFSGLDYYKNSPNKDPQGPDGAYYVLRGGHWASEPAACRITYRGRALPDYKYYYAGFRLTVEE